MHSCLSHAFFRTIRCAMRGNSAITRIKHLAFIARRSEYGVIAQKIKSRIQSKTHSYGLRRDLRVPFDPPEAKVPFTIRPLCERDIETIFDLKKNLPKAEVLELINRLQHVRASIPTCYVAVTSDNTPAYMQWLMGYEQNESIQMFFNKAFPVLKPDEALLENALTLVEFRGKGLMPAAMAHIAERAVEIGARWVITFVEEHNIASLKGCKRAGFYPYMLRAERWFLFRRTLTLRCSPKGPLIRSMCLPNQRLLR